MKQHFEINQIFFQQFSKYLNYKKDNNDLLLYILRQLINDQNVYNRNKFGESRQVGTSTEIQESEFLEKVCIFCLTHILVSRFKINWNFFK